MGQAATHPRRQQLGVLCERYLSILFADFPTLFLQLIQGPLIAFLIAGVFSNLNTDSLTLYFVMALSAFFLGAANSAREIVKERKVFLRERIHNLSCSAYVGSKLLVQSLLMVFGAAALTIGVQLKVPLRVHIAVVFLGLLLSAVVGVAVGLVLSSFAKRSDKAVMMVPLVVIPQILFSDFTLGAKDFANWAQYVEPLMPVHWGYEFLQTFRAAELVWSTVFLAPAVLLAMIFCCFIVSVILLRWARSQG